MDVLPETYGLHSPYISFSRAGVMSGAIFSGVPETERVGGREHRKHAESLETLSLFPGVLVIFVM